MVDTHYYQTLGLISKPIEYLNTPCLENDTTLIKFTSWTFYQYLIDELWDFLHMNIFRILLRQNMQISPKFSSITSAVE